MRNNSLNKQELLSLFEGFLPRIDILSEKQKAIVRLFMNSHSYSYIAKIAGVNEVTVARRLQKIARYISSDNFFVALSENKNLPAEKMEILKDYFVSGLAIKTIATNRNLSFYRVRKIIRQMRNL
jgi:DNA invertase Pin-like site-specific DNA recombinase